MTRAGSDAKLRWAHPVRARRHPPWHRPPRRRPRPGNSATSSRAKTRCSNRSGNLETEIPTLDRWQGRLAESPAVLAEALDRITDAYRRFAALRCYASLRSDEDTRVARHQAVRQEIELLATQLSSQVSFLRPEILRLDPERLEEFLATEPRLEVHAFFLRDLIRQRAHVLATRRGADSRRTAAC